MGRFAIILLSSLALGALYSYIVQKITKNKLILFLPTALGALWFLYIFTLYTPKQTEGFGDLAIVIIAMIVFALIVGNIVSNIIIILNKKDNHKP